MSKTLPLSILITITGIFAQNTEGVSKIQINEKVNSHLFLA
jgi:hypothetical protein